MEDDCNMTNKEFQEPRKRFWMKSRKRPKSDAISINSMDVSIDSDVNKKKKRRRITEVANSIFSSSSGTKLGNTLHRSFSIQQNNDLSFIDKDINTDTIKKKRRNSSEATNSFMLKSWLLNVANANIRDALNNTLSKKEVKRQEAIYELYCGENVLLDDLSILQDFYYEPLLATNILNTEELNTIFGNLTCFINIHTSLRDKLVSLRDCSGFTESVGPTILKWLPKLKEPYLERCRTQIWARHLLQEKKVNNKRFHSFLKRRLETPHSLDLWTYLDVPRSRIVKYPLLIKEILKHTPSDHTDQIPLKEAIEKVMELLVSIDKAMGEAECKLAQSKINVKSDCDPTECIKNATELITEGQLKDMRGMKIYCFLFDTCLVITRPSRRANQKYNLLSPIIPREQLIICTEENSHIDFGFKVCDHFFVAQDKHGKRHWIDSFNKVATPIQISENSDKENKSNLVLTTRNQSTRKSTSSVSESNFTFSLKRNLLRQKRNSIPLSK